MDVSIIIYIRYRFRCSNLIEIQNTFVSYDTVDKVSLQVNDDKSEFNVGT